MSENIVMSSMQLICGTVKDLVVTKGYSDLVLTPVDKTYATGAAVAAAATGQFFNSAALASASQGAEIDVEYFTCCVNGVNLYGHFYRVEFSDGDDMEFVVSPAVSGAAVHGARSPSRRLVWMLPYQTRGITAQKRNHAKWRCIFSALSAMGALIIVLSTSTPGEKPPLWFIPLNLALAVLFSLGISFMVTRRFSEFSVRATAVLAAFGYQDAPSVDLPALSKLAEKKWCREQDEIPQMYQPWRFRY
jgi:hypothetical protein